MSNRTVRISALFLMLLIPVAAYAGDEYVFSLPNIDGPQNGTSVVSITIDSTDDFAAFSLGVCFDDSELTLGDHYAGSGIGTPDYLAFQEHDGGFIVAAFSSLDEDLPFAAGDDIEAYVTEFELVGAVGTIAALEFCELGDPLVTNAMLVDAAEVTPSLVNGSIEIENPPPPGGHVFWIEDFSGLAESTQVARVLIDSDSDVEAFSMAICHDEEVLEVGDGALGADIASAAVSYYSVVDGGVTIAVIYEIGGAISSGDNIEAFLIDYTLIGTAGTLTSIEFCELGTPLVENEMVVDDLGFEPELELGTVGIEVAAATYDLDDGETTTLILEGQGAGPLESPIVVVTNNSGLPDQWLRVTLIPPKKGILGGVGTVLGTHILVETSMQDGDFQVKISLPYAAGDIGKDDPLNIDLRCVQPGVLTTYVLATSLNTENSPGHDGPIGDRFAVSGTTEPDQSEELGDYGVFFNTEVDAGFAWANVDYAAEFVATVTEGEPKFVRGDTNGDGTFSGTADGIYILRWAFLDGPDLPCMDAGDTNDNGSILAIGDALYLLAYAFSGGDAIPAPGIRECGVDPTDDDLDCAEVPTSCD